MAKPNYQYEKRQRELEKKRKKAEKEQRKAAGDNTPPDSELQTQDNPPPAAGE